MKGSPGTRQLGAALICAVLGSAVFATGCGPSAQEAVARKSPASEAEWAYQLALRMSRNAPSRARELLADYWAWRGYREPER